MRPVLPWAGYAPLRAGRVHLWCPKCKRKTSNAHKMAEDPPRVTLIHSFCPRCSSGGKDAPEWYFDADGQEIAWEEIDAHIDALIEGRHDE